MSVKANFNKASLSHVSLAKIKGNLRLDTGVLLKFTPDFAERESEIMERGFDEKMQMNYVKVYYHEEV